jgi:hypothetical protein
VRRVLLLGTLAAWLVQAAPALAQRSLGFGSANRSPTVNQPIDMSNAVAPAPIAQPRRMFGLENFFSRVTLPGMSPRVAVSPLPPASAFPSTQYKNAISPLPATPKK